MSIIFSTFKHKFCIINLTYNPGDHGEGKKIHNTCCSFDKLPLRKLNSQYCTFDINCGIDVFIPDYAASSRAMRLRPELCGLVSGYAAPERGGRTHFARIKITTQTIFTISQFMNFVYKQLPCSFSGEP